MATYGGLMRPTPRHQRPIRGRERELATVAATLSRAERAAAGLVIEGEAGIGKTWLLNQSSRMASAAGWRVVGTVCAQAESEMSMAALGDLLGDFAEAYGAHLPSWQRQALDVALLRTGPTATSPDRRLLGLAALAVLRAAAVDHPIVIAVDDLQWMDRSTASVLAFALRRLHDEPVAVTATLRSDADSVDPLDLRRLFGERLDRVVLQPLDERTVQEMLRERIGPLDPRDARWIVHASDGNPLAALELGRLAAHAPPGDTRPRGALPGDLEAGLRARLAEVSSDVLDVLLVVAAAARPTTGLLVRVGIPHGELGRRLAAAERAGILRVGGDHIRFVHPLYRSTVYAGASELARAAAHRRLASASADIEERTRHLALAYPGRDGSIADELMRAAASAAARGALAAAAELADLAVARTTADERLASRALAASSYHFQAGECPAARALLDEALHHIPPGVARAEALVRRAQYEGNDLPSVRRFLELGFSELPRRGAHALRSALHAEMAYVGILGGDLTFGLYHAERARASAARSRAPAAIARASVPLMYATFLRGWPIADLQASAIAGQRELTGMDLQASARIVNGAVMLWSGDLAAARAALEQERDDMEARGQFALLWEVLVYLAELELRAGRWDLAERYATEGAATLEESGIDQAREVHLWSTALVAAHRGKVDAARAAANEGLRIAELHGDVFHVLTNRSVLGFVEISLGDPVAADDWLAPLPDIAAAIKLDEPGAFPFLVDAIEAKIGLGDLTGARRLAEMLQAQGERLGRALALAGVARCRGLLAAASGQLDEAEAELRLALDHHRHVSQPFDEARTRLALGQVLRRLKQKRSTVEALRAARDAFANLGARLWLARAERDLERVGGRAMTGDELTATERDIARLVARGQRDADIARALFISEHTVGDNLKRIYRKLSVHSRAELAVRAAGWPPE
jgi:DNA-binding CsgD family transcriptional regulator/tetratricopeptide (TPR) repeat protein